jgi:hypothetical protein
MSSATGFTTPTWNGYASSIKLPNNDFNQDGISDVLLQGSNLTVMGQAMDGSGNKSGSAVELIAGSEQVQLIGLADMNGDGISDLIVRHLNGTNTHEVRLRNASGAVTATRTYNPGGLVGAS